MLQESVPPKLSLIHDRVLDNFEASLDNVAKAIMEIVANSYRFGSVSSSSAAALGS